MSVASRCFPLAFAALLTACTASSPQPQPPTATVSADAPSTGAAPGPSETAAPASSGSAATGANAHGPPESNITNEPPAGGTVTSNASPATAGSDRMQAMMELIKANRDGFRKCFDLWGKKNPGQAAKVVFQFFLKPDGTLEKAAMKPDEGDLHAADVETCMINFAKTLTYPKSGVGKDTVYTHRFDFKAK